MRCVGSFKNILRLTKVLKWPSALAAATTSVSPHKHPASLWILGNGVGNMPDEIVLLAGWPQRHLPDLAGCDLEADDCALSAVADVLELAPLDQPWPHRFGRGFALQRLNTRQFVGAHDMHAQAMQQRGVGV